MISTLTKEMGDTTVILKLIIVYVICIWSIFNGVPMVCCYTWVESLALHVHVPVVQFNFRVRKSDGRQVRNKMPAIPKVPPWWGCLPLHRPTQSPTWDMCESQYRRRADTSVMMFQCLIALHYKCTQIFSIGTFFEREGGQDFLLKFSVKVLCT